MLKGLNREAGVRPALSRNCNGEQSRICPLGKPEKAWPSDDPKPGELPVLTSVMTCDAQGGYMCTVYLMKTVLSLFCCVLQLGGCVSWCVVMMYFDRKLTHWQFPVLFLGYMGMKLKKIIKEIENNDESTITVDKANYIALLREVNRLRFKCSQRGALSRSKKMSSKDNGDEPEAVLG